AGRVAEFQAAQVENEFPVLRRQGVPDILTETIGVGVVQCSGQRDDLNAVVAAARDRGQFDGGCHSHTSADAVGTVNGGNAVENDARRARASRRCFAGVVRGAGRSTVLTALPGIASDGSGHAVRAAMNASRWTAF